MTESGGQKPKSQEKEASKGRVVMSPSSTVLWWANWKGVGLHFWKGNIPIWQMWMTCPISALSQSYISMPVITQAADIQNTRHIVRRRLDDEPDFTAVDSNVTFRQSFETVELVETYARAPLEIIEATRKILTAEIRVSVAMAVRDSIFFSVGCNRIPLFTNTRSGRGRTLFEFECVFEGCSAFLDIRLFSGVEIVKWALTGVSHTHSFVVLICTC